MNGIDLVLLAIFLFGMIKGVMNGLVIEVTAILGLVAGVFGARAFADTTAEFLTKWFDVSLNILTPISFFVLFLLIVILCNILARLVDRIIGAVSLGWLNRLAGGVFGLLKTCLIMSILINVFDLLDNRIALLQPETKQESVFYNPMLSFTPTIFPALKSSTDKLFNSEDTNEVVNRENNEE
ncbi:MAG: CvpA family protein [Paludibacteraceae bacterium]|nr:CvpA family protein [Paludibacteraceae bacterium]